jgi:4-aminobutyrate aminotransferase-like enzyme
MFSSAGGSPVSCVVGMTVLDIMRDEGLVENARVVGGHLRERLLRLGFPVHGMGLYLGVELPSGAIAAEVCNALLDEGVIMQPTGDHKNVLKIKPPMVIRRESADYFVDALERVLAR